MNVPTTFVCEVAEGERKREETMDMEEKLER